MGFKLCFKVLAVFLLTLFIFGCSLSEKGKLQDQINDNKKVMAELDKKYHRKGVYWYDEDSLQNVKTGNNIMFAFDINQCWVREDGFSLMYICDGQYESVYSQGETISKSGLFSRLNSAEIKFFRKIAEDVKTYKKAQHNIYELENKLKKLEIEEKHKEEEKLLKKDTSQNNSSNNSPVAKVHDNAPAAKSETVKEDTAKAAKNSEVQKTVAKKEEWTTIEQGLEYRPAGDNKAYVKMVKPNYTEIYLMKFNSDSFLVMEVTSNVATRTKELQNEVGIKQYYQDNPRTAKVARKLGVIK